MTNKEAFQILLALEKFALLTDKQVIAIDTAIKALTQVSVERYMEVNGCWLLSDNNSYSPFDGSEQYLYRCSICYKKASRPTKYCPNCGCFMFGRETEVVNNDERGSS